jgi:hypothetical protein
MQDKYLYLCDYKQKEVSHWVIKIYLSHFMVGLIGSLVSVGLFDSLSPTTNKLYLVAYISYLNYFRD